MLKPSFLSDEYLVSDEGYILTKNKKRKLKGFSNPKGYIIYHLMVNGKNIAVSGHTLVARAFCSGYRKGLEVNHKNGVKSDNRAENLEWVTRNYNAYHSFHCIKRDCIPNSKKVSCYDVNSKKIVKTFPSNAFAARYLHIFPSIVSFIARGMNTKGKIVKNYVYKGYLWKYGNDEYYS